MQTRSLSQRRREGGPLDSRGFSRGSRATQVCPELGGGPQPHRATGQEGGPDSRTGAFPTGGPSSPEGFGRLGVSSGGGSLIPNRGGYRSVGTASLPIPQKQESRSDCAGGQPESRDDGVGLIEG